MATRAIFRVDRGLSQTGKSFDACVERVARPLALIVQTADDRAALYTLVKLVALPDSGGESNGYPEPPFRARFARSADRPRMALRTHLTDIPWFSRGPVRCSVRAESRGIGVVLAPACASVWCSLCSDMSESISISTPISVSIPISIPISIY